MFNSTEHSSEESCILFWRWLLCLVFLAHCESPTDPRPRGYAAVAEDRRIAEALLSS
jgi:hypothetical protein